MNDDINPQIGGEEIKEGDQVPLVIHGQYIKDLSFEIPGAPQVFIEPPQGQPDMNLNLDVQVEGITDEVFEVILDMKAENKVGGQLAYILELKYAGLFTLKVPEQHRAPMLFVECPRLMFPFARAILADVTRDGGFQPLILGPVDFASLFEQNVDKLRSQVKTGPGDA
ncbi:MAG TPA: protein-export chaperone SecB [Rhodospirillaceae bacterium]|nr:protein-export chaperone SecB [Rhodospirillaceae bacterium]|tara:strand:+ start:772 stop:1275 length:504 start_codon:yes stop_codon:yes gene_type:complete